MEINFSEFMLTNQVRLDLSKDKWIKCSTSRYVPVAILWLVLYTRVHYSQITGLRSTFALSKSCLTTTLWLVIYTKVQYFQICSSSYSVTGPLYQGTPFPVNWSNLQAPVNWWSPQDADCLHSHHLGSSFGGSYLGWQKNKKYIWNIVISTLHKFTPNLTVLDLVCRPGYASDITYVLHL